LCQLNPWNDTNIYAVILNMISASKLRIFARKCAVKHAVTSAVHGLGFQCGRQVRSQPARDQSYCLHTIALFFLLWLNFLL
jgi:hypothetical protein